MNKKYPVITLCGSTRFKNEYLEAQKRLSLEGNIVISVGLFGHSGDAEVWDGMDEGSMSKTKEMLDDMHKQKIDMSDAIFVINVNGYIIMGIFEVLIGIALIVLFTILRKTEKNSEKA